MLKTIEGIIIKEIPYKETSKIIHVYTKDGVVGLMCNGARTLKSAFRATTLLFTYGNFLCYYKENKLSTLKSVDIINSLTNIKNDIILLGYLNYITSLTRQIIKDSEANVYDDYINAVLKIEAKLDPLVIANILEIKYLDYLGVGLNLHSCTVCGKKDDIITVDAEGGGYICHSCYNNEVILNPKTVRVMKMYYYVKIKSITNISISDVVKNEINTFLNNYYERYTGLYLKSKEFLKKL